MQGHRIIILGEVHDNGIQHALRAAALRVVDRRWGAARHRLRAVRPGSAGGDRCARRKARPRDADYLIAQARGASSWNWALYKPFVALALEYDLPIVAANLSRQDAMQVATGATPAGFDVPATFLRAHEEIIAEGHCNLLPPPALPGMARAQIARDRALAEAIAPYAARGVVLLTGNGHARTDIGVPHWLSSEARATLVEHRIARTARRRRAGRVAFRLRCVPAHRCGEASRSVRRTCAPDETEVLSHAPGDPGHTPPESVSPGAVNPNVYQGAGNRSGIIAPVMTTRSRQDGIPLLRDVLGVPPQVQALLRRPLSPLYPWRA